MGVVVQALVGCLGIVAELYGHEQLNIQSHLLPLMEIAAVRIPAEYTAENCDVDSLPQVQEWLIDNTQEKFYARKTRERWVQPIPEWIVNNEEKAAHHFVGLKLADKTSARAKNFECAAIFGSTAPHTQRTIADFAERLDSSEINVAHVFLLTGERYADPKADGGKEYIEAVANKYGKETDKVTETMLMQDIYSSIAAKSAALVQLPVTTIDTPRGAKARPNTVDTIKQFLDTIAVDECPNILFISRAPYTLQQAEDARRIMSEKSPERRFEVVGGAASISEAPDKARAAYHMSMALAGSFYGGRERVSHQISSQYFMCPSHVSFEEVRT